MQPNTRLVQTFENHLQASQSGGDPAQLLVAMVNDRIARSGEGFRAGEVITTGTFNGVVEMFPGQRATLTFENIGSVELRLD